MVHPKRATLSCQKLAFVPSLCLETSQTNFCFILLSKKSNFKQDPQLWYIKILRILSYYSKSQAFFMHSTLHNPSCKIKVVIFHLLISVNSFPKHLFYPQSHNGLFSLCPRNLPSHHLCFTFLPLLPFSYYTSVSVSYLFYQTPVFLPFLPNSASLPTIHYRLHLFPPPDFYISLNDSNPGCTTRTNTYGLKRNHIPACCLCNLWKFRSCGKTKTPESFSEVSLASRLSQKNSNPV